jgi:hypothetical protein
VISSTGIWSNVAVAKMTPREDSRGSDRSAATGMLRPLVR